MKKILGFVVALFTFILMQVPFVGTAEAGYVAVVPIDINVDQVERAGDFNGYYWDMIIDRFQYPEYELLDDEKVAAVIPEEGLKSYDRATLAKVADQAGAQVVIAMSLNKVSETPKSFLREPMVDCLMKRYSRFAVVEFSDGDDFGSYLEHEFMPELMSYSEERGVLGASVSHH